MQQHGILGAIYKSFYSRSLYRDVAQNWGGKAFLYLFMLLAVVSIYYGIVAQQGVKRAYHYIYTNYAPQLPVLTFKEGKLSTPENRPYYIADPSSNERVAVIDTSGQVKTLEDSKAPLLITETQALVAKKNEVRIYDIPKDAEGTFETKYVNEKLSPALNYLWLGFFIAILISLFVFRVVQAFIYSIVGKIFSMIFGVNLGFFQIMQIMLVAITPVIIVSAIHFALQMHFGMLMIVPFESLFYFILAMIYLFYGIMANKTQPGVT